SDRTTALCHADTGYQALQCQRSLCNATFFHLRHGNIGYRSCEVCPLLRSIPHYHNLFQSTNRRIQHHIEYILTANGQFSSFKSDGRKYQRVLVTLDSYVILAICFRSNGGKSSLYYDRQPLQWVIRLDRGPPRDRALL